MRKNVIYFLLFVPMLLFAQTKTVTGKVTAASDGAPLPGVNVIVKGTTNGTQTDFDGNYSIKVAENAVLQFSYVGFKTKEKKVVKKRGGNSLTFNILLKDDTEALEEVVVVGYGTQKKANLTGSVSTVKADNIANKPVTSLANALQGVTPGVTVISRPGDVGGGKGTINVRGRGNLGASSPLYVVDGVPVGGDDFQNINPADIESISILKDAAASSIYGSRAAYGVFLVTTKKGNKGELKVQLNSYYGLQTPTFHDEKVNAYQYATLINEANANAGKKPIYDKATLKIIKDGSQPDLYPNNDWYDLVYRASAPIQEHSISFSGGGKTKYYVSGTFFNQESLNKGKDFDRYSFRANTERKFSDVFTLGTNVSFVQENFDRTIGNYSVTDLNRMTPLTVAKHSDGTWGSITAGKISTVLATNNPLRKMAKGGRGHFNSKTLIASIKANLKPMEGLDITGMLSYKGWNKEESNFDNTVEPIVNFLTKEPIASTAVTTNKLQETWKTDHTLTAQTYASYQKDFGLHYMKIMVGLQYEDYQYKYLKASRTNFPTNSLEAINAGSNSAESVKNEGNISEYAFFSQFGRLNYNYDGKYLLEANIRFDQSSKFHKDARLGIFPSFSAAWRVTKENFMEDIKWLNDLKLRASWGELGNVNNVGYYDFYDALGIGTATVLNEGKVDGVWPSKLANPGLSWETVVMTNLGLDASLLDSRLTVQVDVFDKLTKDILLVLPQPKELGLGSKEQVSSNAGKVSNKGIEVSLGYNDAIGEDFTYYISGNVSKIWNEIIDLKGADDQINGNWINKVGESIGSFYMYEADGLFKDQADVDAYAKQNAKPGDIKYKDINGDGKINGDDRKIVGNDVPYFTYGMELGATYKGFDFRVQGQGVGNVKVYLSGEASQAFFNGAGAKTYHLNRWTKENTDPNAAYPRLLQTSDNGRNYKKASSFWLYDASYFRIKNMSLGYTIPKSVTEKYGIDKLRVYTSGTNLFTTRSDKRLKDFDPEMPSTRGSYPMMKVFSLGVNVTF